ncbi:MAG TPA: hypothetical protein VFS43_34780 [Polyangiaceae bacterium]|nr:hypothetical protein [Polyangiaceae bacterium]
MSEFSRDELFERWAERCFGAKEHLTSPFSYEPQAAHSCPDCGLLFVGTSAGDVFLVDGTAAVEPSPTGRHLNPIGGRFEDGVSSIEGCWRCADHLLIASGKRCIAVPPGDGTRRPLAEADGRVTLLRMFPLPCGGQLLFVADERRFARVYLLFGAGERLVATRRLRWSPRWADTEARFSTSRAGTLARWLVVAADGRMARLRLDVERGVLDAEELPPLVEMPRCVGFAEGRAGDRVVLAADEDALHEITPGMTHVGQYATLIELPRIQFVGLRYLFGVPMLTVCAAGGWTGACQWPTARSTHRPTWFLGPALDSDTHGVWVSPHGRDATDAVWTALLSDNRVLRIMLCNPFEVREALCRLTAWEGKTGAERYAQFSVAPWTLDGAKATQYVRDDGDALCLEGALTWLEEASIDRLDAEGYIRLSVEILIAAGRLGRETAVRHARKLQKILVHQLRGPRAAQIDTLQPWLDFLDRYFANVPFSLERKLRLESFLEGEPPKSLNALLHAARLRRQGFDLLQETPQFDVWALATTRDRGGRTWLAAACGDGSIWKARVSTSGELEGRTSVLGAGDPGRFGAYSRVLAFTPGTDGKGLLAAPRHFLKDVDGLTKPRWPPKDPCDGYGYFDKTQIYSMLALGDGFLVGTRSVARPLALWAPFSTDGGLTYIDSPFGLQRREHGPTAGAVCRIWALTELCPGWLAVGAQDGYLRVFPWSRGDLDVAPARARSFFLGSSVRILHRFTVGPRTLLAAGTEGGHLFVFELDPARPTEFAIKFREAFRSSVVGIFTDADGGDATRLFVLDHGGRLSSFDLAPGRSFLGRRNRHHDVWHTASIATWLGKDDEGRALIAVGGWDRAARRGVLRLIRILDYDRSFLRTPTRARVIEEAIQASSRFNPERAEALLASIPVGDASLRATLAEYAARECQFSGVSRIADALRANPDDDEEVKTLLDAERAALDACPPAEAPLRLNQFVNQLISETGKLKLGLSTSRRLRATTLRRLISANALRFWRRAELDPNLLPRFVHRHLQDPEPDVRQEVMRSLAEAMYGLVRVANADPSANLPQEAFPGKRGWGWVVEVIAPHLHPHQAYGSAYDCELDPLAWGATSVLVNLFRLFPNATLAILDDVCRHRVPGPIISLIGRRLQNRKDAAIVAKMNYYLPWESVEPSRHDLLARCRGGARESLPVVKGSPDDVYLTESSLTHRIFRGMLQVNKEDELRNLHDTMGAHCRKLLERGAKDEVSVWLRRAVTRLIVSAEGADRERVVSSQDDELWSSAARLPSPERELAVGSLTHWRRLSVPDLPGQGVQLGKYKLGASFQRSPTVFEVDGRKDCLIA